MESRLYVWYDRIRFRDLFALWIILVVVFGLLYFALDEEGNRLVTADTPQNTKDLNGLLNSIYFSFITATSLGYGDIFPEGLARTLAIIESVLTLLIFGVVISKFVSIKQEVILDEVYRINFQENYDRIIKGLHDFRIQNKRLDRKLKSDSWTLEEALDHLDVNLMSLDSNLLKVKKLLSQGVNYEFVLTLDDSSTELLLNNIRSSLKYLSDTIIILDKEKIDFRSSHVMKHITSIIESSENICLVCIPKKVSESVIKKNEKVVAEAEAIKKLL